MIRFPQKSKGRHQVVLGRHLIGLQETLYKLTDELVIFQSQYQEKNEQWLLDLLLILLLNSQKIIVIILVIKKQRRVPVAIEVLHS